MDSKRVIYSQLMASRTNEITTGDSPMDFFSRINPQWAVYSPRVDAQRMGALQYEVEPYSDLDLHML